MKARRLLVVNAGNNMWLDNQNAKSLSLGHILKSFKIKFPNQIGLINQMQNVIDKESKIAIDAYRAGGMDPGVQQGQ